MYEMLEIGYAPISENRRTTEAKDRDLSRHKNNKIMTLPLKCKIYLLIEHTH